MPVVALANLLEERRVHRRTEELRQPAEKSGKISAVVVKTEKRSDVILEVHKIVGITKVEVEKLNPPSRAGVRGVAQNIQGVAQAAASTSHGATDSLKAARSLAEMSTQLRELVGRFKLENERRTPKRKATTRTEAREEALEEPELVTQ